MSTDVVIIVPGHSEGILARRTLKAAQKSADYARQRGISVEIVGVLDRATIETRAVFDEFVNYRFEVDYGDLGETRNFGVAATDAKYVAFCDADDLFGLTWVHDAFQTAEKLGAAVLHPQLIAFFGDVQQIFLREHLSTDDGRFDYDTLTQYNAWSALCFARRDVLLGTPYVAVGKGCGYEDWQFNLDTLAKGIPHVAVPNTIHWVRVKAKGSLCRSLADGNAAVGPTDFYRRPRGRRAVIRRNPQFDRSWLAEEARVANAIDPQCWIYSTTNFEVFNEAKTADAIWSAVGVPRGAAMIITPRLGIGGVPNVVRNVVRYYERQQVPVVVIVTEGGAERIPGAQVISLFEQTPNLRIDEQAFALQTVVVQTQPIAIHAINSPLALGTVRTNAAAMTRTAKLYVWSFGMGIAADGRRAAPVFWDLPHIWKHVAAVITDSQYWRQHLLDTYGYPESLIHVVRQPVTPDWRDIDFDIRPLTVLWAGRLDVDKGVDMLVDVVRRCPQLKFIVAGSGPLEHLVRSEPRIEYRGPYVDFRCLPDAQIFLMTSPAEGAAQVLLEAQARGLVPVVPSVGGLTEICLGVPTPRNAEDLAMALNALSEDMTSADMRGMARRGYEAVVQNHDWTSFESGLTAALG